MQEFIKPPDLNQARVNKCLIALVNRKIVHKDSSTVRANTESPFPLFSPYMPRVPFCIIGMGYPHDRIQTSRPP